MVRVLVVDVEVTGSEAISALIFSILLLMFLVKSLRMAALGYMVC